MARPKPQLARSLSGLHLWGIAVGLVISGEYFGWSYGWAQAGTLGFLVTTVLIATMYTTFIFSYTELTTAIPHAGGPFAYSYRAFGPVGGYIAGFATLIEFVFAPPAIALAIGAYLNMQFPAIEPRLAAVGAYVVFMTLNLVGVMVAATFELVVTILAIAELVVFMAVVSGGFQWSHFTNAGWGGHSEPSFATIGGIFAAIPLMSALGAIVMYIMSLFSLFQLRRREPGLHRSYRTPLYPYFPVIALLVAILSLIAIVYFNPQVAGLFLLLGLFGAALCGKQIRQRELRTADPLLDGHKAS